VNQQINASEVRLIDAEGKQVGVISLAEALNTASREGLDLVEIVADGKPPICRVMDFGKYLFEQSKKQKRKSKQVQVKEVKLRPVTEIGDYGVKLKKAVGFLKKGDKVKFTVRFRGREISYQEQGMAMLHRIIQDLADVGAVEQEAKAEGRQLTMVIMPARQKH
jgi:translation initiation factor IF-3